MTKLIMNESFAKWTATIMFLSAGTILSANIESSRWGFWMFLVGHVLLSLYFAREKDWPMFAQNFFFLWIDIFGIYRWFIA